MKNYRFFYFFSTLDTPLNIDIIYTESILILVNSIKSKGECIMSKGIIKLLALGIAAAAVLSLAACGGDEATDTSSESESVSDTVAAAESAAPATESTPAVSDPATSEPETAAQTPTLPQSKEELIAAFNQGGAGSLSCASYSQTLTAGKLWMGDKTDEAIDALAADQTALRAKFEKTASDGVALPSLSAGNVASASVSGTTVTFTLNDASATHDSVTQGVGGYINIIDQNRTLELVEGVKSYANIPNANVKVDSASHSLSGGTLTVEFNSDFTQVTGVKFTARQHVQATMTYLFAIKINADLSYDLTAEYR